MKILLIGDTGQVGRELARSLASTGTLVTTSRAGADSASPLREALDVADLTATERLIRRHAPDVVVNATAYTAVDRAEIEAELAGQVNARAPAVMAETCASVGARLIHFSTDYVFDGTGQQPYRESDEINPLGVYGLTKYAGEEAIRMSGVDHLILRTAWVFAPHGQNFLRTMLRLAKTHPVLRVVVDQTGSPTPADLIADVTASLIRMPGAGGTLHLTSSGETSWHGFALAIMEGAVSHGLLPARPDVVAIPSSDYPTPARRPHYSVLDCRHIEAVLGHPLPHWRDGLERTLGRLVTFG